MAENSGLSQSAASDALQGTSEAITETLEAGDKISLVGFGTFSVAERPSRKGRNPSTGKTIKIPARRAVKFKPGATGPTRSIGRALVRPIGRSFYCSREVVPCPAHFLQNEASAAIGMCIYDFSDGRDVLVGD